MNTRPPWQYKQSRVAEHDACAKQRASARPSGVSASVLLHMRDNSKRVPEHRNFLGNAGRLALLDHHVSVNRIEAGLKVPIPTWLFISSS